MVDVSLDDEEQLRARNGLTDVQKIVYQNGAG
jgi:hypothetical protein